MYIDGAHDDKMTDTIARGTSAYGECRDLETYEQAARLMEMWLDNNTKPELRSGLVDSWIIKSLQMDSMVIEFEKLRANRCNQIEKHGGAFGQKRSRW